MSSHAGNAVFALIALGAISCASAPPQQHHQGSGGPTQQTSTRWTTTFRGVTAEMVPKGERFFAVPQRCTQGPLRFTSTPIGGKYGEYVRIQIHGGRPMKGRWEMEGPGVEGHTSSMWTSVGPDGKWIDEPDNAFCKITPSTTGPVASAPPAGGGSPGGGPPVLSGPTPSVTATPPGASLLIEVTARPPALTVNVDILYFFPYTRLPNGAFTFTLWSEAPNDFGDGAYVIVTQGTIEPTDEIAWKGALEAERADADANKKAGAASSEIRNKCYADYNAKKVWPDECRKVAGDVPERDARSNECWAVWTKAKKWSDACRSEFGDGPDPKPQGKPKTTPSKPPPPPPADPPPPKPSDNAIWVHGSYTWNGVATWVWSPGLWKVPQKDVDAGKTANAPTAAPPKKTETKPPPPMNGMVWTPGYWFFAVSTGGGWIWIGGAWRMPAFPGAIWREPAYVQIGAKFVFVPGDWFDK